MTKKMFFVLSLIVVFGVSSSMVYGQRGYSGNGHTGYNDNDRGRMNNGHMGYNDNDRGRMNNGHMGYNDNGRGHMNNGHMGYNGRNNYTANMTAENRVKYDALYEKYVPQINDIRSEMTVQNSVISSERVKAEPDMTKINKAIDTKSQLSAKVSKIRIEYSMEMNKLFPNNRNN